MRYDGHFRLAHELGKHLHEVMGWNGPMTHRQYLAWQCWLNLQVNNPSRSDFYAMQIACEIKRVLMDKPSEVSIKDFLVRFTNTPTQTNDIQNNSRFVEEAERFEKETGRKLPQRYNKTATQATMNQQKWFAAMGANVIHVDKQGNKIGEIKVASTQNQSNKPSSKPATLPQRFRKPTTTDSPQKQDISNGQSDGDRESSGNNVRERFKVPGHVKKRKR